MFNVQTSDLIEESKVPQGYTNVVDSKIRQQMKSLLLNMTYSGTTKFLKDIEAAKGNDQKMISVFKYPNVTFLTSQVFENIKLQLLQAIDIIKEKKSLANIA